MKKLFYLVTLVVISLSIFTACEPSIGKDGMGKHNGHEYVDLGLPSGLKWATCNVGATTPEEYGDYLTKYCYNSDYGKDGFTDTKTVLDPEDDAATANWGGAWRMPTIAEQDELRNNCTWTLTTQNGVNGYKVTGPNGNSIFLPAAGFMYEGTLGDAGSGGIYWSSSLYIGDPSDAYGVVYFNSDNVDSDYSPRYFGQSVRPVCK